MQWDTISHFVRSGWTISYLPELNIWVSLHGYIPYLYFNTSTDYYSFTDIYIKYLNGEISETGVYNNQPHLIGTQYGNAIVWKHNGFRKGMFYKEHNLIDFTPQHAEFEFIHNDTKTADQVFYNISYTLQTFKYNSGTGYHDINILNHGFTDYHIYNTHQIFTTTTNNNGTGIQPLEYLVNVRRVGNEWKINGFRDYADLTTHMTGYYMSTSANIIGGINAGTISTSHIVNMFTNNTSGPYYVEDLNTNYLDLNKNWNTRRKFIDKWAGIRLIYNNIENNLLNLYSTEVGSRKYYR